MRSFVFLLLLFYSSSSFAKKAYDKYETKVEVPEPLFVDLVRSLSAEYGEWEVNSLFYHTQGYFDSFSWAPEVEFVLNSGTAIEFEFPMQGGELTNYKVAMQQRTFQSHNRTHLHGVQLIYEADNNFFHSDATLFYIVAHRFNHYLSILGLYGAKSTIESYQGLDVLFNQSLFFNYSEEIDLGLELNYTSGDLSETSWQLIPQLHLAFEGGAKIQFGFGGRREGGRTSPIGTLRLILEFNK